MSVPLCYLSQSVHDELEEKIAANLDLYLDEGFKSKAGFPGWGIDTGLKIDQEIFLVMDPEATAMADCKNSLLVYKALQSIPPALACDSRLWTRLTHIEAFDYSRARWLKPEIGEDNVRQIELHFFASGRRVLRDYNAIARLWWNGYIANKCRPDDPESALNLILSSADIRSATIQRTWISFRTPLLAGILRIMERVDELQHNRQSFRDFMKNVNALGGGLVFEIMPDNEIDKFLEQCIN